MSKFLLILVTLGFNIAGGYFAKLSAVAPDAPVIRYVLLALSCYGLGFFSYIFALKYIPLFVAQSLLVSQYVFMVAISFMVFDEPISLPQGLGIALIFAGLFLVVAK